MKKKVISLILTGTLVLSLLQLTGCAGNSASSENSTAEETSDAAEGETTLDGTDSLSYSDKLFDQSYVHEINIQISEEDWADLKENPLDKTKYQVNVEIDGEEIDNVSFATKGNTSLSSIASDEDSDRYSFKINFGKYEDGQTYYGLDKLNLNNIYADATYMKDYVSYEIFRAVGVEAPLTSYVELKINGESFGLYLALEEVGDSFLERNDQGESELYKPETEMLGNMDQIGGDQFQAGEDMTMPDGEDMTMPDGEDFTMPDGEDMTMPDVSQMFGSFGGSSQGASLAYTDDNLESYSDIFDNAITDVTEEDEQRVVDALKDLSEGNAEEALDVTEVINYFVAHNFVLNYDSYTGTMLHNYYLMETDGKLSVVPWDYNLAYGAFSGSGFGEDGATSVVNCGIDSPLSGASESDRPLWAFITSNEEYLEQYHESFSKLIEYLQSGELQAEMNRVYEMIYSYVENDNSAFYTVDEFEKAYETLVSFCELRTESIAKQLEGSLSTVTDEQNEADRVDASSISISDMGTQNNVMNNSFPQNMPSFDESTEVPDDSEQTSE